MSHNTHGRPRRRGRAQNIYRKTQLRKEAEERAEKRAYLTPGLQLGVLDRRLGKGVGAAKERERLQYLIDNPPPKKNKKK